MANIVILIGAPGSGKGTQAKYLVDKYGCRHVAAGNLLREEVKSESEIGLRIKDIMSSGQLVSDDIVNSLMGKVILSLRDNDFLLLDGYPRSVEQAKFVDDTVFRLKNCSVCVIQINVNADSVVERASGRVICEQCKAPYKAGDVERCTVCGCSSLIRRKDDEPGVVRERIKIYNTISSKVIDYYGSRVFNVSGDDLPDNVFQAIDKIVACEFGFLN